MKANKLSELTLEDLTKQKKLLTGVAAGFGIVLLVAYSFLLYLMIKNNNFTLITIIPLGFITLLPAIIRLSQVNAEIKTRSSNSAR